jgi:hypothetical protein
MQLHLARSLQGSDGDTFFAISLGDGAGISTEDGALALYGRF